MPDIWMPLTAEPMIDGATARLKNARSDWLDMIGRLRAGTNPKTLQAQLQSELHGWLASHLADMNPQEKAVWQKQSLRVSPAAAGFPTLRRNYSQGLLLLMVTAAACCWWPAPTSPTCCWRAGSGTGSRPRCAWPWARRASRLVRTRVGGKHRPYRSSVAQPAWRLPGRGRV